MLYLTISESCLAGTYRPTDQTECVPCEEGTISTETEATSCTSCDLGKQPNSDKTLCGKNFNNMIEAFSKKLSHKKIKTYTRSQTYLKDNSRPSTTLCALNKIIIYTVECSSGTYKDSTVTICTKCPENSITEQAGTASCTSCPAGTISNDERTQCGNCLIELT